MENSGVVHMLENNKTDGELGESTSRLWKKSPFFFLIELAI